MGKYVRKLYFCRICDKSHPIKIPRDYADNQKRYPFVFFTIHKYEGNSEEFLDKKEKDIIATLYIDNNYAIRDVDVAWEDSSANIVSEYDTQKLVGFLIEHVNDLQDKYDSLMEKYTNLLKSSEVKDKKTDNNNS